jgi:hypothetical protein
VEIKDEKRNMSTSNADKVFDYRLLRLLMGMMAFALPFVVHLISSTPLSSISAAYHTEARDIFVGLIFVVSAFMLAYKGHTPTETWVSGVASLATALIALYPTSCDTCAPDTSSQIHYVASAILFSILAYFCLGPFRKNTKGQGGKKARRARIYLICGWIIVLCIVTIGVAELMMPAETMKALRLTYWVEVVALEAFGVAWIVAGKAIRPLVDEDEALKFKLFE